LGLAGSYRLLLLAAGETAVGLPCALNLLVTSALVVLAIRRIVGRKSGLGGRRR